MIYLYDFIKKCERDLVLQRNLSEEGFASVNDLSDKHKMLLTPILKFIGRDSIDFEVDSREMEFLPEERILVCRLIPLYFSLDTSKPTWSSHLLTQAIQSVTTIRGIQLSEIGIAFLEILGDFAVPLNRVVYHLCVDMSKEFTVHYRQRLQEFETLLSWESPYCLSTSSVAYLKYALVPINCYQPRFILETMIALIQNEFFETFLAENKYLFEDLAYRQAFLECLYKRQLSKDREDLILAAVNAVK